jgi:hypothetical protein
MMQRPVLHARQGKLCTTGFSDECGQPGASQAFERALDFHRAWPSELRLIKNDCRVHTNAMVHKLTGEPGPLTALGYPRPAQKQQTPHSEMDR